MQIRDRYRNVAMEDSEQMRVPEEGFAVVATTPGRPAKAIARAAIAQGKRCERIQRSSAPSIDAHFDAEAAPSDLSADIAGPARAGRLLNQRSAAALNTHRGKQRLHSGRAVSPSTSDEIGATAAAARRASRQEPIDAIACATVPSMPRCDGRGQNGLSRGTKRLASPDVGFIVPTKAMTRSGQKIR